ncbi:MAG TPA: Nif3-like dinuclear metal center hexameric protein [Bryobacteraceae bacterium]|nr:Nif3-like dinuclear metal center hexameric protein [Bryobacteraceae bacterium]
MAHSRRSLLALCAAALPRALAQTPPVTARQVIERIQSQLAVQFAADTVDTFKAGDPDTPVRGIATTVMATFDVIKRAAAANCNLVITHEPTFYNHQDSLAEFANDEVAQAKLAFIKQHSMVVWRFHDYWHRRKPDGIQTGMAEILGWSKYVSPGNPRLYILPPATLESVARDIQSRLNIRTLRVVGDPKLQVSRFALSPGFSNLQGAVRALSRPEVDVLVVGEPREWEGVEYVQDAITAAKKKALIILGHAISEENGMNECARWLRTILPNVPVQFVPAGEPFWTPAKLARG